MFLSLGLHPEVCSVGIVLLWTELFFQDLLWISIIAPPYKTTRLKKLFQEKQRQKTYAGIQT